MAEFGKRQRVQSAPAYSRRASRAGDLAGAAAILATGRVPFWAKISLYRLVFVLLIAAAAFWFMILPYAGDLLRDHRLAGTWQPAYDLRVIDGKCTRYHFLVTTCNAKIRSLPDPDRQPQAVAFIMAFAGGGGESLVPMRSTIDPSAVAIGYAAETKLLNRTLTFLALAGGFIVAFLAAAVALLRGRYVGGAAHRALLAGLEELTARVEHAHAGPRATV